MQSTEHEEEDENEPGFLWEEQLDEQDKNIDEDKDDTSDSDDDDGKEEEVSCVNFSPVLL